ncbi:MAG: DUF1918 domain-containing protein [Intrasporangium sp.]|uniref:DUF1918 domain-containing protein n=1 Tax=Intrasporangium sp. TaxID=1925024 RepID=UPI003F7F9D81
MKAKVGDAITMTTEHVGQANRHGTIREVHGPDGGPPYLVEWSDGHTGLITPGPGSVLRVDTQQAEGQAAT